MNTPPAQKKHAQTLQVQRVLTAYEIELTASSARVYHRSVARSKEGRLVILSGDPVVMNLPDASLAVETPLRALPRDLASEQGKQLL